MTYFHFLWQWYPLELKITIQVWWEYFYPYYDGFEYKFPDMFSVHFSHPLACLGLVSILPMLFIPEQQPTL